jgi:hypothetical protein
MVGFSNFLSGAGFIPSIRSYERKRNELEELRARFYTIQSAENFQRYQAVKIYVESPEYETDLNLIKALTYKGSHEYLMEKRYRELKKYKEVKAYIKKGKESDSPILKEFISLQNKVRSSAFKQRVTYLKNKKKYKESDPYKKRQEYKQLRSCDMVKQYYRLQKKYALVFAEMDRWEVVFSDEFRGNHLSKEWNTKPFWSTIILSEGYVQNSEDHSLTDENVIVNGGMLQIAMKKEPRTGLAWNEKLGFIPKEAQYTSGTVNTANHFQVQYGKIEAKIRIPRLKNCYHAFWLNQAQKTPGISIFNFCNNYIETGMYQEGNIKKNTRRMKLNHKQFYIVEIEWNEKTIMWRINGKKTDQKTNIINTPLFLNFASGIIGKINDNKLPVFFELDWVRVYKTKQ